MNVQKTIPEQSDVSHYVNHITMNLVLTIKTKKR
jgi:hypothetical protein